MVSGLTLQWWEVEWLFGVSLFLCGSVEFSLNCFTAFKCMLGHAVQQITRITQLQSEKYKGKNAAKYSDLLINDIAWSESSRISDKQIWRNLQLWRSLVVNAGIFSLVSVYDFDRPCMSTHLSELVK